MSGRLKPIDYKEIIRRGIPWKDPTFPHGKYALFANHTGPAKGSETTKRKWLHSYTWKRASAYFGKDNFSVFDGIDPTDVIMGACNDCYMFAALSGMAENRLEDLDSLKEDQGERIRNNFLTKEVNSAGCYAIKFNIDGQERTIVVDDYFPFTTTKAGKEIFAFAKSKHGENEIWV